MAINKDFDFNSGIYFPRGEYGSNAPLQYVITDNNSSQYWKHGNNRNNIHIKIEPMPSTQYLFFFVIIFF